MEAQPPPAKVPKLFEGEEEQEKVIRLLGKRLEKHDENRKAIQDKLREVRNELARRVDELEERITGELCEKFTPEEGRLQSAFNVLCENWTISALQKARAELSVIQSYEIIENKEPSNDIASFYELKTERRFAPNVGSVGLAIPGVSSSIPVLLNTIDKCEIPCGPDKFAEERERLMRLLEERLEMHDNNRKAVQDKLHETCDGLRTQIDKLEKRIAKELEEKFIFEDNRLQSVLNELRRNRTASALQKARAELLVEQSYEVIESKNVDEEGGDEYEEEEYDDDDEDGSERDEDLNDDNENDDGLHENDTVKPNPDLTTMYELKTERRIVPELMEVRKPTNVRVVGVSRGRVSVEFTCLNPDEERVLSDRTIVNPVKYKCTIFKRGNKQERGKEYPLDKNKGNDSSFTFAPDILEAETTYGIRVKMVIGGRVSEWSDDIAEFTPEFKECCMWKKCPDDIDDERKYRVHKKNPRVATSLYDYDGYECTIIGNAHIPLNKVTSWSIKILKSEYDGYGIYIGVAPFDINQNDIENYYRCGWYFDCYRSTLSSGPPHKYGDKDYGPRKENGQYVHSGDSVGVVVDTTKKDLSFVLNGANLGVAYEGIPLDKPLVPCVLLLCEGDSVELDTSEVKENNVDSSVLVPSNIAAKNGVTWDSITLAWDEVKDASLYQIEVDGNKSWGASTTNGFTKMGLLPETEHSFRVRAVRGNSMSEWSGIVKGRTLKESFKTSGWKECPDDVYKGVKYTIDEKNPRVATSLSDYSDLFCIIIGNTPIPLSTVTSWSIKILESKKNDGYGIYTGAAPFDINQNDVTNYYKCGWYFDCYRSTLSPGPSHNYDDKAYGPRKEKWGQYVHTGDSVGVVVGTTKGELSFVLNGVNLGVAFEGIPLDKPLVPCVLLDCEGGSVELDTSEMKENVDSSVPVPSNIISKSITWDSITLTWDEVDNASFYQIEVDGNKCWYVSIMNGFTKMGLLPETEHSFRVRTVRGSSVSEWSDVVKGRTLKESFETSGWKECSEVVYKDMKYIVNGKNPRVATSLSGDYCTIIGNTRILLNTVTSWSIKVLKSKGNDGGGIYIGAAPFDINQNDDGNYSCGWYFNCYRSTLSSGPPHKYGDKDYGPRKENGEYVHTGDSVGVVVDTTKKDLSFVLNGVNLGVAYNGIPLDKPLVPCVLLCKQGDSVEFDTSEVKETDVDNSVPVPSNIAEKSITWDSITLTWDEVKDASFYQIEVDGSKSWGASTTNGFTKMGLLSETEYSFRVRTVKGSSVSEWSNVVKGRTLKESFKTSGWKECPDDVDWKRKYRVDGGNSRAATKVNWYDYGFYCTIIGNTPIPFSTITSWSVRVLKSKGNDGRDISIGVAPNDINQNADNYYYKCGWYFDCYRSTLWSEPSHNSNGKDYGPRKGDGQYVHTGDSVGVVMDTTKGDLSFFLNGVNLGVAYEGIPLDKPLVPCILLHFKDDSVELIN